MDDAAGKITNDREALGFDDFAEVKLVELAEAVTDMLEQGKSQRRRVFDKGEHFAARQKINFGFLHRGGGGRTRAMFNDRHLAENLTRAEPGKNPAGAGTGGNFYQPAFHEIDTVAGGTLAEYLLTDNQAAFLCNEPERLKFSAIQMTEQRDGFERRHPATLGEKIPA